MATAADDAPIQRSDIQAKLRQIDAEVRGAANSMLPIALAAGAAVLVTVIGAAYLLGRRRGKGHSSVVEIRRF